MSLPIDLNGCAPWYARSTGSPKSGPGQKLRCRLLLLLLLPLALTACTTQPVIRTTVVLSPPAEMLRDCPRPDVDLSINSALADSLIAAHARIAECNLDRQAAREYIERAKARLEVVEQ